ncbi:hypothetical protein [Kitasatospora aureofaciens]|uniref:hypothetical protein n=1 Tax=Kitasatospora aureofaciens TaxID=1894 RepID=UPI000B1BC65C|nr:hypothetical protein [Kitasatospora aureofaciens]
MGSVWWRYGRDGARYCLLEALESPDTREAYDERQKARETKARQVRRTEEVKDLRAGVPEVPSGGRFRCHRGTPPERPPPGSGLRGE